MDRALFWQIVQEQLVTWPLRKSASVGGRRHISPVSPGGVVPVRELRPGSAAESGRCGVKAPADRNQPRFELRPFTLTGFEWRGEFSDRHGHGCY